MKGTNLLYIMWVYLLMSFKNYPKKNTLLMSADATVTIAPLNCRRSSDVSVTIGSFVKS